MLHVPASNDFKTICSDETGTQPGGSTLGSALTAGTANTYGSYVNVLTSGAMTTDCYGILINVHAGNASASDRRGTVTIGRDLAGGSSYADWLTDLVCGSSAPFTQGTGVWYYFPIFLKSGASLAAKYANQTASATCRCAVWCFGDPRRPEAVRYGTKFHSFGASAGQGTAVTGGTTSEGAWTQLGSASDIPLFWWQLGYQAGDTTMTAAGLHCDLAAGDGSNKKMLIENQLICVTSNERINNAALTVGCTSDVAVGDNIYGRFQSSTSLDSNTQLAAYGVG